MEKKKVFLPNRRQVIKAGLIAGAGMMMPWRFLPPKAFANPVATGLSDPALQPKFVNPVPDALGPWFKYIKSMGNYKVKVRATQQWTGLVDSSGSHLMTNLWGYGDGNAPGPTQFTWPCCLALKSC